MTASISNFIGYPNPWNRNSGLPITFRWDCDKDVALEMRWYRVSNGHLEYTVSIPQGSYPCGMQGKNFFYQFNNGLSADLYVVRLYEGGSNLAQFSVVVNV